MKKFRIILILAVAFSMLFASNNICHAADKEELEILTYLYDNYFYVSEVNGAAYKSFIIEPEYINREISELCEKENMSRQYRVVCVNNRLAISGVDIDNQWDYMYIQVDGNYLYSPASDWSPVKGKGSFSISAKDRPFFPSRYASSFSNISTSSAMHSLSMYNIDIDDISEEEWWEEEQINTTSYELDLSDWKQNMYEEYRGTEVKPYAAFFCWTDNTDVSSTVNLNLTYGDGIGIYDDDDYQYPGITRSHNDAISTFDESVEVIDEVDGVIVIDATKGYYAFNKEDYSALYLNLQAFDVNGKETTKDVYRFDFKVSDTIQEKANFFIGATIFNSNFELVLPTGETVEQKASSGQAFVYRYVDGKYQKVVGALENDEVYSIFRTDEGFEISTKYEYDGAIIYCCELHWNIEYVEAFEKILSLFVRWMGKGLYGLITVVTGGPITLDDLIFDRYNKTTLTLFSADNIYYRMNGIDIVNPLFYSAGDSSTGATTMLNAVFAGFTNLAIVAYVLILVYLGTRILFSSASASKKAQAQKVVLDWVKGILILFLFPYVIRYTILLNHGFVTFIYDNTKITDVAMSDDGQVATNIANASGVELPKGGYMGDMFNQAEKTQRLSYAICWFVMLIQLIQFLIVYIKRMITIVFLIAIFPLVTLTYAIDKLGDGKAQAFGNWFKEFVLQVFIQSFHAINYVLIMGIVLRAENWLLRIIGITYIAKGGDILRGLFSQMSGGVKDGGPMQVAKSLMQAKVAINAVKGIKDTASKLVGSKSLVGKGVGMLFDARNSAIHQRSTDLDLKAKEAANARLGTPPPSTPSSLITDDKTIEDMEKLATDPNLSDDEKRKLLNELSGASEEQLKLGKKNLELLARSVGNVDQSKIDEMDDAIAHAAAFTVLTGQKRTNYNVNMSADIVIKDRKTKSGNSLISAYTRASKVSDDNINMMKDAHSITVDPSKAPTTASSGMTKRQRADAALQEMVDAKNGGNISSLNRSYAFIKEGIETGDADIMAAVAASEFSDTTHFENFGTNLAVQTLNNAGALEESDRQKFIDRSIGVINTTSSDKNIILNGLEVDRGSLHAGHMPVHVTKQDEDVEAYEAIKERIAKEQEDEPYARTFSQEELDYERRMLDEERRNTKNQLVKGVLTTALGGVDSMVRIGVVGAVSGIVAGSSTAGNNDLLTELATNIPTSMKLVNETIDAAESYVTSGKNLVLNVADKVAPDRKPLKHTSNDVQRESMDINRDYYENEAIINQAEQEIITKTREKNELMRRLEERTKRRIP